ncbi:M13 family metallopeptidase, partial [bacterium BMS3Abin03]|nr:M13 family metallopeptidase [bacterium BMS3Abin03]
MFKTITKLFVLVVSLSFLSSGNIMAEEEGNGVKGFNRSNMDTTVSPAVDFYQYVNGTWVKNNPVPDEYSIWATFTQLAEENYKV